MRIIKITLGRQGTIVLDQYTRLKPSCEVEFEIKDPARDIPLAREKMEAVYYLEALDTFKNFEQSGESYDIKEFMEKSDWTEEEAANFAAETDIDKLVELYENREVKDS